MCFHLGERERRGQEKRGMDETGAFYVKQLETGYENNHVETVAVVNRALMAPLPHLTASAIQCSRTVLANNSGKCMTL